MSAGGRGGLVIALYGELGELAKGEARAPARHAHLLRRDARRRFQRFIPPRREKHCQC